MFTPKIEDRTIHVIKMKFDAEYRAEFEALQADLLQAQAVMKARGVDIKKAFHSVDGDINKESSPELQEFAALLATVSLVSDPIKRRQMIKDWATN